MILPLTLATLSAATLVNLWVAGRVSRMRVVHKVSIGDGGSEPLTARMRAHSNFIEYTPFFLLLLAGIEMARGASLWLWVLAILFLIARILHALGMDAGRGSRLRQAGMMTTALILVILAAWAAIIAASELMRAG
jgi:uncharacterized membrane protein YecN with MAPEG domain